MLDEEVMPKQWYNVAADLLTPWTRPLTQIGKVSNPRDLEVIFQKELIEHEMSAERWVTPSKEIRKYRCCVADYV